MSRSAQDVQINAVALRHVVYGGSTLQIAMANMDGYGNICSERDLDEDEIKEDVITMTFGHFITVVRAGYLIAHKHGQIPGLFDRD